MALLSSYLQGIGLATFLSGIRAPLRPFRTLRACILASGTQFMKPASARGWCVCLGWVGLRRCLLSVPPLFRPASMLVVRHPSQVGPAVQAPVVCGLWAPHCAVPGAAVSGWAVARPVPAQGLRPAYLSISAERFSSEQAAQVEAWRLNSAEYEVLLARLGVVCAQVSRQQLAA